MTLSYYQLNVKGLNIDALLAKISGLNISLKDIKRLTHDNLTFKVRKQDYAKIKPLLNVYDIEIEELGLAKLKKYILSHIAVLIALPILVSGCYFSNLYLWDIEINGLNSISKQEVYTILESNNIKRGNIKDRSVKEIKTLLLDSGKFAQVSAYYRGNCLIINLSEKLVYTPTEYQPIKAKFSGIITNYKLEQGTINFVLGEYVNVGDILVLPYMIDKNGNKVLIEPKAEIEAKVYLSATVSKPQIEKQLVKSNKTYTEYKLYYKKAKKSFSKSNKPFVFYQTKVYNKYISNVLPIIRQKVVYYELIETTKTNDLNKLKPELEAQSKKMAEDLAKGKQILEETTSSVIASNILYATTSISFIGSII